jgi:serine phosphatase RsbU (regulator of sigma subunit)
MTARNTAYARELILNDGPDSFACALIGRDIAGRSGLEIAAWIALRDACLSRVLMVGNSDEELMLRALRMGMCNVLRKPIDKKELMFCVGGAVADTLRKRGQIRATMEAHEATRIHHRMVPDGHPVLPASFAPGFDRQLESIFFPVMEAGGDFFTCHLIDDQRLLLITGDVSGHDMKAGFISAYFMGICRGMLARDATPDQICQHFHQFLLHEWNDRREPWDIITSLGVCFLLIDFGNRLLHCSSNGFPSPIMLDEWMERTELGTDAPPLGWFDVPTAPSKTTPLPDCGTLIMFSDGMTDLCGDGCCCHFGTADSLLDTMPGLLNSSPLHKQIDDVLVVRLNWAARNAGKNTMIRAFFCCRYAGDQHERIDELQAVCDEALRIKLPDLCRRLRLGILLCCREALLNAMLHGCEGRADRSCSMIMACIGKDTLRVCVCDNGKPFNLDPDASDGGHIPFGLLIIKGFTSSCTRTLRNNTLCMDFKLSSDETDQADRT